MNISQEIATLIDTLATAASKIGSTPASAKLNALIVELLPPSETATLQQQVSDLQISGDIKQANLDLARTQFGQLNSQLTIARSESATPEEQAAALQAMADLLAAVLAPL